MSNDNYKAVVVRLGEIRVHPNADRLKLTTVYGNQVIVGLDEKEGDLGLYFNVETQLSEEFCKANDLIRRKNPETGKAEGGMFDENRRVRAQKFRGEVSDGFWIPLASLAKLDISGSQVLEGEEYDTIAGIPLCCKYIPKRGNQRSGGGTGKPKSRFRWNSPMFKEHFSTSHLGKQLHEFNHGDHVIVTEKLHGTSQRFGYVKVDMFYSLSWFKRLWLKFIGYPKFEGWQWMNGTRRVVLKPQNRGTGYHSDELRDKAIEKMKGNLRKGEVIYFEVVGFEPGGKSIMPEVNNAKLKDDEFVKQYGATTVFRYGCSPEESKVFVYRITQANEDGETLDYSWKDVKLRCKELGLSHVPEIESFLLDDINVDIENYRKMVLSYADTFCKGGSLLDQTHIREGVCVRIEGGLQPKIFKHKSFEFKLLEGIIKDSGESDMEEEQDDTSN